MATEAGLEGHGAPESQEICFVADDDHGRFLRERLGERPGLVVDRTGNRLGEHTGTYNYTIGQRKGLGIPSRGPLYVTAIDAGKAEVMVGDLEDLEVGTVVVGALTWQQPPPAGTIFLQVRSSGAPMRGRILHLGPGPDSGSCFSSEVTVALEEPARAVACGQTAVVYADDEVICAGTIVFTQAGGRAGRQPQETQLDRGALGAGGRSPVV